MDEDCLNEVNVDVSGYKLPQRRKVKGRPRGSKTTGVDGVRIRGCKVKPFNQKTKLDQQNIVLGMIVTSLVRGKNRLYDDMVGFNIFPNRRGSRLFVPKLARFETFREIPELREIGLFTFSATCFGIFHILYVI